MGYSLQDVAKVGGLASRNIVSIGVSLDGVHVPRNSVSDSGELGKILEKEEVEQGTGIHNEPGCGRKVGKETEAVQEDGTISQQSWWPKRPRVGSYNDRGHGPTKSSL
jgi:dihydroxyacetone kinase